MSRQTEDGNHEGYVVHVFADGMYGGSWGGGPIATTRADGTDLEGADWQTRTADEIVGWRAHCDGPYGRECWRGHLWTRAATAAEQDLPRRRIYHSDGDLDWGDDGYSLIDAEWDRHIAPSQAVYPIEVVAQEMAQVARRLDEAVEKARADGASWADISQAARVSERVAQERWGRR